jgi:RimJ/RimL family protein N-acetyltransferase
MTIVLQTGRLVLRRFSTADAEGLLRLESDPEVVRFSARKPLPDLDACRRHLVTTVLPWYEQPGGHGVWAVVERVSGEFVGVCSLRPALAARYAAGMGYGPGEVELGYGLRRVSWGQGYATELARALVRRAFDELAAPRLVASVSAANTASIRVLEKAGLQQEGGLFYLPDEDEPSVKYALAKERLDSGA